MPKHDPSTVSSVLETLLSDRSYYFRVKDWKRVADLNTRIRTAKEVLAQVSHA